VQLIQGKIQVPDADGGVFVRRLNGFDVLCQECRPRRRRDGSIQHVGHDHKATNIAGSGRYLSSVTAYPYLRLCDGTLVGCNSLRRHRILLLIRACFKLLLNKLMRDRCGLSLQVTDRVGASRSDKGTDEQRARHDEQDENRD
jgi:hypothetical protein